MLLSQNSISPPAGGSLQPLSDFGRSSEVDAWQIGDGYVLELNKAYYGIACVTGKPGIDCAVVFAFLQLRLCQSPTTILASLDRHLQRLRRFHRHQIVLR